MISKTTRYIGIFAAAALLALAGATVAQAKNGADDPVGQHQSQGADDPAGQHQSQGADDPVGHDQGQGTDDPATQKTDDSKPSKQKRHGRKHRKHRHQHAAGHHRHGNDDGPNHT